MRFAVFATIAALAGSAFAAAMPAAEPAPVAAPVAEERGLLIKSIPQILAETTSALEEPIAELYAFTASTITEGALYPVLLDIDLILTTAVTQVLLLVGQTLKVILTDVDGTTVLTVQEVATLVADFLCYLVDALNTVGAIVDYDLSILGTELGVVQTTLCTLISEIITLISPILDYLTPLVTSLLVPLENLVWNNLIAILGLL